MKTGLKGLLLALAVLAAGCRVTTKNDASVEFYAICGFPDDATKCATTGKCDTVVSYRPGVLTRYAVASAYHVSLDHFIQVNNAMPNNANPEAGRVNTNDFTIDEVHYKFGGIPAVGQGEYVYPLNHIVPAGGSSTPYISIVPEEVMVAIDALNLRPLYNDAASPTARLDVTMWLVGHTRDGHEITSAEWTVPVDVYDVDTIPPGTVTAFTPACPVGKTLTATCPHGGQTGFTVKCE